MFMCVLSSMPNAAAKRNVAALLQGELGLPPVTSQALVKLHGDEVEAVLRRDPYDALMQV